MRRETLGGTALILGAVSGLVTMALHPTGHEVAGGQGARSIAVHALALFGVPLSVYGAFVLTRLLAAREALAELALSFYGAGAVALVLAATASGFIATSQIAGMAESAGAERVVRTALLESTHDWNQAFTQIFVAASSLAIALWSIAILRTRLLSRRAAVYGLLVAGIALIALLSGHLRLDIHGFGALVLAQAVWSIALGLELRRGIPA